MNSSATFERCIFQNNWSGSKGGSLAVIDSSRSFLSETVIDGAYSESAGGAIYLDDTASTELVDSHIIRCTAESRGGAIYAAGHSSLSIKQSSIHSNRAISGGGGGILLQDSVTANLTDSLVWVRFFFSTVIHLKLSRITLQLTEQESIPPAKRDWILPIALCSLMWPL